MVKRIKRKAGTHYIPWTAFVPGKKFTNMGPGNTDETYTNSRYQVFVHRYEDKERGRLVHLSIKSLERVPIRDWRDLQRIKNELCGTTCEAVELFPAESRLVDMANQYHLWVPEPGYTFPFGFEAEKPYVSSDPESKELERKLHRDLGIKGKTKQRPFEAHHHAHDCLEVGPIWRRWLAEIAASKVGED